MSARRPAANDRPLRRAAALAFLLTLSACATQSGRDLPAFDGFDARSRYLAAVRSYGFSGRIAVRAGDDGFNGNLHWEQRRDYFDARVSGPLGAGTVLLAGDSDTVTITDDDGEVTALDNPEFALRQRYGWHIPVASLRYWALGIPDPALPADLGFDEAGLLSRLQQGGWSVTVDDYREAGGQPMPRLLTAEQDDTRVRLVIDRWNFH